MNKRKRREFLVKWRAAEGGPQRNLTVFAYSERQSEDKCRELNPGCTVLYIRDLGIAYDDQIFDKG